jgi:lipoyl(octanoyl) transferase
VLHDRELTYAVTGDVDSLGGPRAAYVRINRALVAGLARLGVPATIAGTVAGAGGPDPRHDTASPCFQAPAAGEVVARGRKLVGSAQRCERRSVLQHGSILLDGSQQDVLVYLTDAAQTEEHAGRAATPASDAAGVRGRPTVAPVGSTTLRELLGAAPAAADVAAAVAAGFETEFGTRLALTRLSAKEAADAARLCSFYEAPDWTWRR